MLRHIKPGMLVFSVLYILLGLLLLLAPRAVADVFCIALGLLVVVTNVNLDMLRGLLRDYGQGGAASFSIENGDAAISDGSASAEPKKATLLDRLFYHGLSARMAGSKVLDWTYRLTPEADATALGSEMPAALAAY